jgi:hypothetical protein
MLPTSLIQWPQPPLLFSENVILAIKNVFLAAFLWGFLSCAPRWRMRTKSSGSTLCVRPRARPPAPHTSPTSPSARSCTHGRHFYARERAGASVDRVGVGLRVCLHGCRLFLSKVGCQPQCGQSEERTRGLLSPARASTVVKADNYDDFA